MMFLSEWLVVLVTDQEIDSRFIMTGIGILILTHLMVFAGIYLYYHGYIALTLSSLAVGALCAYPIGFRLGRRHVSN